MLYPILLLFILFSVTTNVIGLKHYIQMKHYEYVLQFNARISVLLNESCNRLTVLDRTKYDYRVSGEF